MECIPRIQHVAVVQQSPRVLVKNERSFLSVQEDFHQQDGQSSDLNQKRSGIQLVEVDPQGEWDRVGELLMVKFRGSGHPVFVPRVHYPEER